MDFADFEKSSGFLVRCADMLRNQGLIVTSFNKSLILTVQFV